VFRGRFYKSSPRRTVERKPSYTSTEQRDRPEASSLRVSPNGHETSMRAALPGRCRKKNARSLIQNNVPKFSSAGPDSQSKRYPRDAAWVACVPETCRRQLPYFLRSRAPFCFRSASTSFGQQIKSSFACRNGMPCPRGLTFTAGQGQGFKYPFGESRLTDMVVWKLLGAPKWSFGN